MLKILSGGSALLNAQLTKRGHRLVFSYELGC